MRTILSLIFLVLVIGNGIHAQVSIKTDNTPPHASAGVDVDFSNRGFLPPRMTRAQMLAIGSPAEGLVVFCADCGDNQAGAITIFQGGEWRVTTMTCIPPLAPAQGTHTIYSTAVTWNWNTSGWASGYKWNTINDYNSATEMGLVTTKPETNLTCNTAYVRYVWAYNACGHVSPATLSATTASTPPAAPLAAPHSATSSQVTWNWLVVPGATGYKWNTVNIYSSAVNVGNTLTYIEQGLNCNTSYTRYVWAYSSCGQSAPTILTMSTTANPPAPVAGSHSAGTTYINWVWNGVTGATGFKWNTVNNYATATNLGNTTSYTENGLTCNTAYTRYLWAYNACGYSLVAILTFSTAPCGISCPSSVTDPRDGQVYGVVAIGSQCWTSRNMNIGVKIPGVQEQTNNMLIEKYCYDDLDENCDIYGGLYQWGEAVQYANGASNYNQWNPPPVMPVQGICPPGWHVPTHPEWDIMVNYLGGAAVAGGKLKEAGLIHWAAPNTDATNISGFTGLPGGNRLPPGAFAELTYAGYFWTSTGLVTTAYARQLFFNTGAINTLVPDKVFGFSVRCVKNQ
jgi:uncharacterized protein (TIGR02145 family)